VRVQENGVGSMDVSDYCQNHGVPLDPLSTPHTNRLVLDHQILQVFSFQPCRAADRNYTVEADCRRSTFFATSSRPVVSCPTGPTWGGLRETARHSKPETRETAAPQADEAEAQQRAHGRAS
jgi:hypothetical protein